MPRKASGVKKEVSRHFRSFFLLRMIYERALLVRLFFLFLKFIISLKKEKKKAGRRWKLYHRQLNELIIRRCA